MEMTMIGWLHQLGTLEFWEALLEALATLAPLRRDPCDGGILFFRRCRSLPLWR